MRITLVIEAADATCEHQWADEEPVRFVRTERCLECGEAVRVVVEGDDPAHTFAMLNAVTP